MTDLTGTWRGHYEQGGRHGIEMHVEHRGDVFVGWMRDVDTLTMTTCPRKVVDEHGDEVEDGELDVVTSLPETSLIEGLVEVHRVTFVKRYQGAQRFEVWDDGRVVHRAEFDEVRVVYEGTLDETGDLLTGRWRIREANDAFELRRVRDGDQPTP